MSDGKWRPMSTAPKDGTEILLGCPQLVGSGHYWRNASQRNPRERWVWNGYPDHDPTRWMPLPEPPK